MSEKNCMFCTHLSYEAAGHGEYADPAGLECKKGHFKAYHTFVYDEDDFRRIIVKAQTCPDYNQVKS